MSVVNALGAGLGGGHLLGSRLRLLVVPVDLVRVYFSLVRVGRCHRGHGGLQLGLIVNELGRFCQVLLVLVTKSEPSVLGGRREALASKALGLPIAASCVECTALAEICAAAESEACIGVLLLGLAPLVVAEAASKSASSVLSESATTTTKASGLLLLLASESRSVGVLSKSTSTTSQASSEATASLRSRSAKSTSRFLAKAPAIILLETGTCRIRAESTTKAEASTTLEVCVLGSKAANSLSCRCA